MSIYAAKTWHKVTHAHAVRKWHLQCGQQLHGKKGVKYQQQFGYYFGHTICRFILSSVSIILYYYVTVTTHLCLRTSQCVSTCPCQSLCHHLWIPVTASPPLSTSHCVTTCEHQSLRHLCLPVVHCVTTGVWGYCTWPITIVDTNWFCGQQLPVVMLMCTSEWVAMCVQKDMKFRVWVGVKLNYY